MGSPSYREPPDANRPAKLAVLGWYAALAIAGLLDWRLGVFRGAPPQLGMLHAVLLAGPVGAVWGQRRHSVRAGVAAALLVYAAALSLVGYAQFARR